MYSIINGISKYVARTFIPINTNADHYPRYNKSLVYKLMCNHQNQFKLVIEMRLAAQQVDYVRARRLIKKLSKLHEQHTLSEQSELYPLLASHSHVLEISAASIANFQHKTIVFNTKIQKFCNHWCRDLQTDCNLKKFSSSVDALGEALDQLMTDKEMTLYPLYNKASSKNTIRSNFHYDGLATQAPV